MTKKQFADAVMDELEADRVGIDDDLGPFNQRDSIERVVINGMAQFNYGVKIPNEMWREFRTMNDVCKYIGEEYFDE